MSSKPSKQLITSTRSYLSWQLYWDTPSLFTYTLDLEKTNLYLKMSNSSETCSVCLSSNALLIEVSATDANQMKLSSKLSLCVPEVDWSGNCCICPKCIEQLEIAYIFCRLCLQSYEVRRQETLLVIKTEEPPLESKEISDFQMKSCLNEDEILSSSLMSINELDDGLTSEDLVVQRHSCCVEDCMEEKPDIDIENMPVDDIDIKYIDLKRLFVKTEESCDIELTPTPNIVEAGKITDLNLLPEISRKKYENAYKFFMDWRKNQKTTSYSENVLMAYFGEISKKYKSTTLWTQYSMLRTILKINNDGDIAKYSKLRAFLKRQSDGYQPKKSNVFTPKEIDKFIKEAPDEVYLMTKVSLIMGIVGACRRHELYEMEITNVSDLGSCVLVTIPRTKTKNERKFTITGNYYKIFKKYADLRPTNVNDSSFFMNYQKGKYTAQKVGINKLGSMGKQIAKYLKLPNPESYTGHCFRRSAATIVVDAGEDKTSLKRHSGRKSTTRRRIH